MGNGNGKIDTAGELIGCLAVAVLVGALAYGSYLIIDKAIERRAAGSVTVSIFERPIFRSE
jgi:hypothetical protein